MYLFVVNETTTNGMKCLDKYAKLRRNACLQKYFTSEMC